MVSVAAFGLEDPGSNPGWFAVTNLNQKLTFKIMQACCTLAITVTPALGDTLVGGDK